ncbi:MAG: SDR family NAD(P)-dependent oxidoreductase [Alphaproteobacteria bacterium]|nr:SDR family NAD(P)-dependent oxidoreductase [Alphaproteobacteria bacterium]
MSKYKNILITGASSGIGEALALYYAANGAEHLFLCARNSARLEEVAKKCRAYSPNVHLSVVDVSDSLAVEKWINHCNGIAKLQLVFANAGVATAQETSDNIRNTFAINVGGVVNTVLPALTLMQQNPHNPFRHIVITSSIAGYHGLPACPSYSASKACVKAWGEALRIELGKKYGIKVSVIAPGFVRSRITDQNTCPMPFFMEADRAASLIAHRVEKNIGMIAFPWPMRFCAWLISILPNCLSDLIYKLMPYKV